MAGKFYTEKRRSLLVELINRVNATRGTKAALPFDIIERKAMESWNEYQKTSRFLRQEIKRNEPYTPTPRAQQEIRGLVHNINKEMQRQGVALPSIRYEDIAGGVQSWNELQHTMKAYRGILKKGGLEQTGTTPAGYPIYRWQEKIMEKYLAKLNESKKEMRKKLKFSHYAGTMGTEEEVSYRPKANPLKSKWLPSEIASDIRSIIRQSFRDYNQRRLEQYKQNFLQAVNLLTDTEIKMKLYDLVSNMSALDLYASYTGDRLLGLNYFYASKDMEENMNKRAAVIYNKLAGGGGENA